MDDIDPTRRGLLTLLAALPGGGNWIWRGSLRPVEADFTVRSVSYDTGPGSTAELLRGAAHREDWCARLAGRLAAPRRVRLLQDGVERGRAELAGELACADGEVTGWGELDNAATTDGPAGQSGWTLRIEGGPGHRAFVQAALDVADSLSALSADAVAARGLELAPVLRLKAPTALAAGPARPAPAPAPASAPAPRTPGTNALPERFTGSGSAPNEEYWWSTGSARSNVLASKVFTFGQGEAPAGAVPRLVAGGNPIAVQQRHVRVTWPDGSAREVHFCYLLPSVPAGEGNRLTVAAQPAGGRAAGEGPSRNDTVDKLGTGAKGFLVRIRHAEHAIDKTWDVGRELGAAKIGTTRPGDRKWTDGPADTTYLLDQSASGARDLVGPRGVRLTPQFEVSDRADGRVRVRVTVEQSNTEAQGNLLGYDVAISYNGEPLYTEDRLQHVAGGWWSREFFVRRGESGNQDPDADFAIRNIPPARKWRATGAVSNFDPTLQQPDRSRQALAQLPSPAQARLLNNYPYGTDDFGQPGGQRYLGPAADENVLWMNRGQGDMLFVSKRYVEALGFWGLTFREGKAGGADGNASRYWTDRTNSVSGRGMPLCVQGRPSFWWIQGAYQGAGTTRPADLIKPVGEVTHPSYRRRDAQHHPQIFQTPYLATGEWFYLERHQFAAAMIHMGDNAYLNVDENTDSTHANSARNRRYRYGSVAFQQRGDAWAAMLVFEALLHTPDADPFKRSLQEVATDFVANWAGILHLGQAADWAAHGADVRANYQWSRTVVENGHHRNGWTPEHAGSQVFKALNYTSSGKAEQPDTVDPKKCRATWNPWNHGFLAACAYAGLRANVPNIRLVAGYLGERFAKHSASGKGLGILQQYTAPARGEDWGYFTSIDAMFDAAAQSGPNAISQAVNRGMLGDLVHGYPNIMAVGIALASDTIGSARPTQAYDQWIGAQAVANFANNPKWRVAPLFVRT